MHHHLVIICSLAEADKPSSVLMIWCGGIVTNKHKMQKLVFGWEESLGKGLFSVLFSDFNSVGRHSIILSRAIFVKKALFKHQIGSKETNISETWFVE